MAYPTNQISSPIQPEYAQTLSLPLPPPAPFCIEDQKILRVVSGVMEISRRTFYDGHPLFGQDPVPSSTAVSTQVREPCLQVLSHQMPAQISTSSFQRVQALPCPNDSLISGPESTRQIFSQKPFSFIEKGVRVLSTASNPGSVAQLDYEQILSTGRFPHASFRHYLSRELSSSTTPSLSQDDCQLIPFERLGVGFCKTQSTYKESTISSGQNRMQLQEGISKKEYTQVCTITSFPTFSSTSASPPSLVALPAASPSSTVASEPIVQPVGMARCVELFQERATLLQEFSKNPYRSIYLENVQKLMEIDAELERYLGAAVLGPEMQSIALDFNHEEHEVYFSAQEIDYAARTFPHSYGLYLTESKITSATEYVEKITAFKQLTLLNLYEFSLRGNVSSPVVLPHLTELYIQKTLEFGEQLLVNLESPLLKILNLTVQSASEIERLNTLSRFQNLNSLELIDCSELTPKIIDSFPASLTELTLEELDELTDFPLSSQGGPRFPHLQHLTIHYCPSLSLDIFALLTHCPCLNSLQINVGNIVFTQPFVAERSSLNQTSSMDEDSKECESVSFLLKSLEIDQRHVVSTQSSPPQRSRLNEAISMDEDFKECESPSLPPRMHPLTTLSLPIEVPSQEQPFIQFLEKLPQLKTLHLFIKNEEADYKRDLKTRLSRRFPNVKIEIV